MPERAARVQAVLLVEDDRSIARYVEMALEEDPVQLTTARTLGEARRLLQAHRYDVVLCDLMLPDGDGMELLRELGAAPQVRRVAFSAALHGPQRAELARIGVGDVLPKPVALDALRAVLGLGDAAIVAEPAADVVATYFGGDRALYDAYRTQCLAQFAADRASGDADAAASRWTTLRHLAHSLKSVLRMLGDDAGSRTAREVEDAAAAADATAATAAWQRLREHLAPPPGPDRR